jgi:chromosome segregation ATPase
MTVNRVDRALTEEERKRKAEDADRAAEAAARQAEQDKMDSVLTSSYATEGDLERAYKERFDLLDQSVEAAKVGIASQEKSLTDLLAHAARLEREGKPVPATVNDSITAARTQVAEQRAYMEMREKERTSLQNEYETVRARYRKLKGSIGADAMTD